MRKRTISSWRWAGLLCLLVAMATTSFGQQSNSTDASTTNSSAAQNAIPHLIKFTGTLQNLSGKPITGPVDVTFSLYAQQSGGSALWFETQTVQADSLGNYTVLLGAMTPTGVPMELFTSGEAHWLGVQVSNLPEQSRVLLVSVPYAMKAGDAETLGGKPASDYVLSSQTTDSTSTTTTSLTNLITSGSTKTTTTTSESPVTNAIGASYIPVFTDSLGTVANSIMTQSGAKIGINTATPAFNLDLNGAVFMIGPKAAAPGAGGTMRFRDDTGTQRWLFGIPGTAGSQDFQMYNYANGHAPLFIQNGAASYSLYLAGNGDVGIGTTSPAHKLDVNGDINASGTISGNGSGLTNVGSSSTVILGSTATFTGDVSTSSNLNLPATNSAGTAGVINLNGSPFIHAHGTDNTFVGTNAGNFTTTGTQNTGTGFAALSGITSGSFNTAYGAGAMQSNLASHDTAIGYEALFRDSNTGGFNTASGVMALFENTSGFFNTANGADALQLNTSGTENTGTGQGALYSNDTGEENSAFGGCALIKTYATTPTSVTCGRPLATATTTGSGDTALGFVAGFTNTTGALNTFLGFDADASSGTLTNATAIGAYAEVGASNSLVLGSINGVNGAAASVKVGIGTTAPVAPLEVASSGFLEARFRNDGTGSDHTALIDTENGDGVLWRHGVGGTGNGLGLTSGQFYFEQYGHGARLVIDTSGNVGIGTNTPTSRLDVNGTVTGASADYIGVLGRATGTSGTIYGVEGESDSPDGYGVVSIGNVHVYNGNLGVDGDVTYSGGGCLGTGCSSDERLKTKIRPFNPSLDELAALQPVRFNWRASNPAGYPVSSERAIGLIAQQVKQVLPRMVGKDKNGYYTVNYTMLPFMLLSGVRQLKTRNDSLRAEVGAAKEQIATLHKNESRKDARIQALTREVEQLKKQTQVIAELEARLNRDEAQQKATRVKLARVAHRQKKHKANEIARVNF